ncbi:hypothetical protein ACFSJ3_17970 [Corallincola platygyrae]|uniref:Transporter substrate-binding domain-containing protein n=1 Tax=Corallincola platygyrae TaxID=1193278 RepID=A0ABW4XS12_9GAMM
MNQAIKHCVVLLLCFGPSIPATLASETASEIASEAAGEIVAESNKTKTMPDTVLINRGHSRLDIRYQYPKALLNMALEKTEDQYGSTTVDESARVMNRERALLELELGEKLHVMAEAVKPEWEQKLIPVRFPIRKGLQGYRLFLVRRQHLPLFAQVQTFEQFSLIPTGSGAHWSTRWAMEKAGMEVVTGIDYESLFRMLSRDRFLSFGRGVNEVFDELKQHQRLYTDLEVEPTLALYIPLPTYFFVSPKYPELASRIEQGLMRMLDDGSFDQLFMEYHGDDIARAKLSQRKIFRIENPNLSSDTPLTNSSLWYSP